MKYLLWSSSVFKYVPAAGIANKVWGPMRPMHPMQPYGDGEARLWQETASEEQHRKTLCGGSRGSIRLPGCPQYGRSRKGSEQSYSLAWSRVLWGVSVWERS